MARLRVSVHKFSSCDGCQLALLNRVEEVMRLADRVAFVHFAELGYVNPDAPVDVAFVEGSVSTPEEVMRIRELRKNARTLVTIGACATAGGIQALRNLQADGRAWVAALYPSPEHVSLLGTSHAISRYVAVDLELWGCPVDSRQVFSAIQALALGVMPINPRDSVCMACKREGNVCVLVAHGAPCMGPVTRSGCGALCPRFGRACYACYGPSEQVNGLALTQRLASLGLDPDAIARRFLSINNAAGPFTEAGLRARASQ